MLARLPFGDCGSRFRLFKIDPTTLLRSSFDSLGTILISCFRSALCDWLEARWVPPAVALLRNVVVRAEPAGCECDTPGNLVASEKDRFLEI